MVGGSSPELVLPNEEDSLNTVIAKNNDSGITLDPTISYLSNMLLEENVDEEDIAFKEGTALQTMEKFFADIIGEKYPPPQDSSLPQHDTQPEKYPTSTNEPLQEQFNSTLETLPALEYNKGVEEGMKFLPNIEKLMIDVKGKKLALPSPHSSNEEEDVDQGCVIIKGSNGKKKSGNGNLELLEGRNCKIPLVYSEEPLRDAKLDEVILYYERGPLRDDYFKKVACVRETMQGRMCGGKEVQEQYTDCEDLLIRCSLSIAADDHQAAKDIIQEIRKQALPDGNWNQRLALVLANALEGRLTGTGMEVYNRCVAKRISTSDIVKIQYLFMTVTPFIRGTYCVAKDTILSSVEKEKACKLHIIDFGIDFGFQWPSLIQELSKRKGGAVKLKITGIDFPHSGFRPSERVDETGRRLEEYARSFGVPFEYHGIASKWEDISIEDLKIGKDELLIVNSMYRFRQLGDETVALDCPRSRVLNLIWRLKPHLFLQGISNGTFSPFFVTRFKQVMLQYASVFDILDAFIPRDNMVRQLIERDILARQVMNLIACDGLACIERPETYKQWHLRNLRAGFEQVPVDPTLVEYSKQKLKEIHDKRYFVEEESYWLLIGWRGRTLHAISIWRPKD
ncbi:scarecrow-like protein 9 [Carex rostrata]